MCERFLKFIPSGEAFWLLDHKPNAFRLLTYIANTARRSNGFPDGLTIGQCHLQHWKEYNLTEQEYRTAKHILIKRKHIVIIETNRTRKKSTTGTTTASTLVQLISSTVYDINLESGNDRINDRATTDQRLTNDKQESKECKESKETKSFAQSPKKALRSKDNLSFDFSSWKFTGITDADRADWKRMYPSIDLEVEILKAAHWLRDNPSKSNKTLWRRYLTGWLKRNNEWTENKKAYQSAKGAPQQDRRTKDVDGNPVENQYKGKF